jgi:hypothetical protein
MSNNLAVSKQYAGTETQRTVTAKELSEMNNPVLQRLAKAIENRNNIIDLTNYSRMHNRHNRS